MSNSPTDVTHPVRGVVVAALGLLAGAVTGMLPGAAVAVLVTSVNSTFNATVLVASVMAGVTAAAVALSRWGVPRVAGETYRRAPRAVVRRAMGIATVAVALLVSGAGLGGSWRIVLLWFVGIVVAGAAGTVVGTADNRQRGRSWTRWGRPTRGQQDGAIAAEHIAVLLLVGAVVAALVNLAIPGTVANWAQYAACTLFGDDGSCVEPAPYDPGPCLASSSSNDLHVEGSFVISLDRDLGYKTERLSDGTVVVTYDNGSKVGTGVGAGLSVELFAGDTSSKAGLEAQASIKASFQEGQSWEFTGPDAEEDATNWIEWHSVNAAAADLAVPGGSSGLLGKTWDLGTTAVNELLNLGPLDLGMDVPTEPSSGAIYVAGGIDASAGAFAGAVGEDASDGQVLGLGADVEAALSKALGVRMNSDGTTTAYLDASTVLAGQGTAADHFNVNATGGFQLGDASTIALTLDSSGAPVEATVTTRRVDEAGLDLAGNTDVAAAFGDAAHASGSTQGLPDAPSMYEVSATLDLSESADAEVWASLLAGTWAQDAGPVRDAALQQFYAAADITAAEYEIDQDRWGAVVNAEAVAKAGGGLTVGSESSQVLNAHYYDPATGSYATWDSCLAGSP